MTKNMILTGLVAVAMAAAASCGGNGGGGTGGGSAAGGGTAAAGGGTAATGGGTAAAGGGTATLPNCASGMNAYATYGTGFGAVNESIFTKVVADNTGMLGSAFGKIGTGNPASTADDVVTFKGKLAAFLVHAYGGPSSIMYGSEDGGMTSYSGVQDMTAAHTGLAITSDQYDYFISSIVVPALTDNGVTTADATNCFAPVITGAAGSSGAAFKATIVGH